MTVATTPTPRPWSSSEARLDPFGTYDRLRDGGPVEIAEGRWLLMRHDDVNAAFVDTDRFSSDIRRPDSPVFANSPLVFDDPPRHTQLRRLVAKAFTPSRVAALEPAITVTATALLDAIDRSELDRGDALHGHGADGGAATDGDRARRAALIEESLRIDSPVQVPARRATVDVEYPADGVTIPAGSFVMLGVGAANRDPAVFPEPHDFVTDRPSAHLAFGHGIHFCLGAALARLEATVTLELLAERYEALTLAGEAKRTPGIPHRGFDRLPIRLVPRREPRSPA